ncbi:hypothetical protein OUZ56_019431 [Daphnia magna]|uniref:Uncharacterized protein n=1 Tax=Daphnia magna TaxID=35525 RepID=A0ABQ9ZCL6_9CRUS|nr:hypothetical protein OUZ56_019431 [Daphnia magna]
MENKKLFSTFWGRSWEFGRQKVVMEIFGGKKTIRKSGTCVWVFFECRTPCWIFTSVDDTEFDRNKSFDFANELGAVISRVLSRCGYHVETLALRHLLSL